MSVFIIRAFVRWREGMAAHSALPSRHAQIDRTLLVHAKARRDLYQKLLPLLESSAETSRPRFGFHPGKR